MANLVKVFEKENFKIRTIIRNDEVWFVAKDIATILEYSETSKMTERLDEDEKCVLTLDNIKNLDLQGFENSTRGIIIINESGLYSSILGSRKLEAKSFKNGLLQKYYQVLEKMVVLV